MKPRNDFKAAHDGFLLVMGIAILVLFVIGTMAGLIGLTLK